MEIHEPAAPASTITEEFDAVEAVLIRLTREAGVGERRLEEIITDLAGVARQIRAGLSHLHDAMERRDLTYDDAARLQEMRRRALWLYRRSRLEALFYSKLRLERMLRDSLYRHVLEAYDELSAMEADEARLRGLSDDALTLELFQEKQVLPGREDND